MQIIFSAILSSYFAYHFFRLQYWRSGTCVGSSSSMITRLDQGGEDQVPGRCPLYRLPLTASLLPVIEHWRKMSAVAGDMGSMEAADTRRFLRWSIPCQGWAQRTQKLREQHHKYGKSHPCIHCLLKWHSMEWCELAIWFVSFLAQQNAQLQLTGLRAFPPHFSLVFFGQYNYTTYLWKCFS
jgi:hypothetical protein